MKKALSLLILSVLSICCCLSFFSCNNTVSNNDTQNTTCDHNYQITKSEATCTTGGYTTLTCTFCGSAKREYSNALGHTTDNGTCSRCNEKIIAKIWEKAYYVDEFNNPTNQAYIRNSSLFVGVFSNSATTNSNLYARILIDEEDLAIKLWEYGRNEVNAYSTTYYNITILDKNGTKHYTTGTMYKNSERIYLEDFTLANLLKKNDTLKVYIVENSDYGYNTSYLFEIQRGNFISVYSSL